MRWKSIKRAAAATGTCLFAAFSLGCSPVKFDKSSSCGQFGNEACKATPGDTDDPKLKHIDTEIRIARPQADILFINDNSGSMSFEQSKMSERFPDFIESLGSIDYRIAITTTDVDPSKPNSTDPLKNGNFIEFGNGSNVLTPDLSNIAQLFSDAIKRPETLTCEDSDFEKCPSPDERGIYAANLAVSRGDTDFFREKSHLAVVILSDEDERSRGGEIAGYPLEDNDLPETFVKNVKDRFGKSKSLAVHAIIVKPGDTACLNEQNSQTGVRGFEGHTYAELANLTDGRIGSICASDYGAEMGAIGASVVDAVNAIDLACSPVDDEISVSVTPEPAGLEITLDKDGKKIRFNQTLPPDTKVRLVYDCAEG